MGADAAASTIRVGIAAAATGNGIGFTPQLADRNGSRAQDGGNDGRKQRGLGNLSQHGLYSFRLKTWMIFTGAKSGLTCARKPFDLIQGRIIQHPGPDFLNLPRRVN
jgi:hypothetical protein